MSQRGDQFVRSLAKGIFAAADLFMGEWPGPRILIYHQVADRPLREMDVSPQVFARQAEWLADEGRIVEFEEALIDLDHAEARHNFVLTFDDGYLGVYRHAYPILRDRGLPFTLYVTSQLVESQSQEEALNWDQINEMQESGLITLGAHTHTHPDLRQLAAAQVEEEILVSNELIEQRTGVRPRHFAYTKGYWAPTAERVVKRHYETATLGAGPPINSETDFYRISRLPVQRSDGFFFFKHKIARGMRLEEWTRSRLKGYENPKSKTRGESTRAP